MAKLMARSILARSLMTGAASLALLMASAVAVRAQVVGADGAPGANCTRLDSPECNGGNGGERRLSER
jgi:hypothetical protein